jgi:hypothetical protein
MRSLRPVGNARRARARASPERMLLIGTALMVATTTTPRSVRALAESVDDSLLEVRIEEAIERGRSTLQGHLRSLVDSHPGNYPMGRIALCLAAILEARTPGRSEIVQESFRTLESLPLRKTYSVACYLFALHAYWQQLVRESAQVLKEKKPTTAVIRSRQARGDVRKKMHRLIRWLIRTRVKGKGVWSYGPGSGGGYDHSNTQFAVLGLGIGIENGIPVPDNVLVEIAHHLLEIMRPQGDLTELRLTPEKPFGDFTPPTYVKVVTRHTRPHGCPYGSKGPPTTSMTAAAASDLLVVRRGLQRSTGSHSSLLSKLDQKTHGAMAWMVTNMDAYIQGGSHYYYTLYSLEKVGDLGNVKKFNGRDWYREGAVALLDRQLGDGGWGRYVDTSFALLFLTRATRPQKDIFRAPRIFTGTDRQDGSKELEDRVYVDLLGGFISCREFFLYLIDRRDRKLLPVAEQVVRNYGLDRQHELARYLILVWNDHDDAVASFCKKALEDITRTSGKSRDFYEKWQAAAAQIVELFKSKTKDPEVIRELLEMTEGTQLKIRLLDYVERESIGEACDYLVEELLIPDYNYRSRVHAVLERFSGMRVRQPSSNRGEDWKELRSEWKDWLQSASGGRFRQGFRIKRVVASLNEHDLSDPRKKQLLEELVESGRDAVPAILATMRGHKYRVELIVALEQISREYHGFLVEDWERWWAESGQE